MAQSRHMRPPEWPEGRLVVRSLSLTLPGGYHIEPHDHPWAQLIYATGGVMTVTTASGAWVAPSHRAVWVPAHARHGIEMRGTVSMRTLYLRPGLCASLPARCAVMGVPPLLREIILRVVRLGVLAHDDPAQSRLAAVLLDELVATPEAPLDLRLPADERAMMVAERVRQRPGGSETLAELARGVGASARTIERLFSREVGMPFGRWRQHVRLLHALTLLAEGQAVATVALDAGYESTSAFIAMFRRATGTTPARYFAGHDPIGPSA